MAKKKTATKTVSKHKGPKSKPPQMVKDRDADTCYLDWSRKLDRWKAVESLTMQLVVLVIGGSSHTVSYIRSLIMSARTEADKMLDAEGQLLGAPPRPAYVPPRRYD